LGFLEYIYIYLCFIRTNSQGIPALTAANFKAWKESVKYKLYSCGSEIWILICEGYDGYFPSSKVLKKNAQARQIIFENRHNADLEKVRVLNLTKEI